MGIIYCYTNLINGKKYIGQTINPSQRYSAHKSTHLNEKDPEYDSLFHRALRKYGWDNFKYEVLNETDDINLLNELEAMPKRRAEISQKASAFYQENSKEIIAEEIIKLI